MTSQTIHSRQLRWAQKRNPESGLWLPPHRMRLYQRNKVVGGLLIGTIFLGWLVLQWSNPTMRLLTVALIGMTLWTVVQSIMNDQRRSRGRQVQIADGELIVTMPNEIFKTRLGNIADARWCDQDNPGLSFYDLEGKRIVRLDTDFLADQAEARSFLGWARTQADLRFEVRWP